MFYFNPSSAFDLEKIHVKVKINDKIILDTVVDNCHIDSSVFLGEFVYRVTDRIVFEINGKATSLGQAQKIKVRCASVFIRYDDHSLILEEVNKIEDKRAYKGLPSRFKQLFDSVKASSGIKYHQLTLSIHEECND